MQITTQKIKFWLGSGIAMFSGIATWAVIEWTTGSEAWDHQIYWMAGYPFMIAISALLGFWLPEGRILWPIILIVSQFAWMLMNSFGQAMILPLTVVIFMIISIPCVVASYISSRLSRKSSL